MRGDGCSKGARSRKAAAGFTATTRCSIAASAAASRPPAFRWRSGEVASGGRVVLGTAIVGERIASKRVDRSPDHGRSRTGDNEASLQHLRGRGRLRQMVFDCPNGAHALAALRQAGAANLRGKILVQVGNPLDTAQGAPTVGDRVQHGFPRRAGSQEFPDTCVVKARLGVELHGRRIWARSRDAQGWIRVRQFGRNSRVFWPHHPRPGWLRRLLRWLGVALFTAGGALRIWPVFVLGRRFSGLVAIQPGHTLVTTGIYGIVRHPSYLGLLVNLLGWALAFRSGIGVLLTALVIPPLLARIHAEEALLREHFGEEYDAYCQRTARLIPGFY
jgi:protein-S-isoprenylcysteine O-methyltransferase Ste14